MSDPSETDENPGVARRLQNQPNLGEPTFIAPKSQPGSLSSRLNGNILVMIHRSPPLRGACKRPMLGNPEWNKFYRGM